MAKYEFSNAFKINLYFYDTYVRKNMFIISFICLFMYGMHNISQAPSEALKIQEWVKTNMAPDFIKHIYMQDLLFIDPQTVLFHMLVREPCL